jgi:hypothetical protein
MGRRIPTQADDEHEREL